MGFLRNLEERLDAIVSVIVPLHNDASYIEDWTRTAANELGEFAQYYEIVFIDSASTDETCDILRLLMRDIPSLRVISLSRSVTFDVAASAGMESAIGDYVVITSLRSDPPRILKTVVERCRATGSIIIGQAKNRQPQWFLRRSLRRIFHWYARTHLNLRLIPGSTQLIGLSRSSLNSITRIRDAYRQLRLLIATVGFTNEVLPYEPRQLPHAQQSFLAELRTAIDIAVTNSMHPLRFASRCALMAGFFNVLYLGYVVIVYLTKPDVAGGWPTLSIQHGAMFFFIFVILAILSEYIGRILEESRDRPLYFIAEERGSAVQIRNPDRLNVTKEI